MCVPLGEEIQQNSRKEMSCTSDRRVGSIYPWVEDTDHVRRLTVHFFFSLIFRGFSASTALSVSRGAIGVADSDPVTVGPQDGLVVEPECFWPSEVWRSFLRR